MRSLLVKTLLIFLFVSCSSEISCNEIKYRDGKSYYKGENLMATVFQDFKWKNKKHQILYERKVENKGLL